VSGRLSAISERRVFNVNDNSALLDRDPHVNGSPSYPDSHRRDTVARSRRELVLGVLGGIRSWAVSESMCDGSYDSSFKVHHLEP
jgi:hypothetical protein